MLNLSGAISADFVFLQVNMEKICNEIREFASRHRGEPHIEVGIMSARQIDAVLPDGREAGFTLRWLGGAPQRTAVEGAPGESFVLRNVTIGVGFHWQRAEHQRFVGSLIIRADQEHPGQVIAVNRVPIEEYLKSVISSEMSATASPALLRAHAVVSRSWLLRQLLDHGKHTAGESSQMIRGGDGDGAEGVDELVRWYDREDHRQFDVCADDHCQRYQGITRQTTAAVAAAVEATRGLVLTHGGVICDARFSKCCGGVTERFENCWEPESKLYLEHLPDTPRHAGQPENGVAVSDADHPFCDTRNEAVLAQVLNNYDREKPDFFSWEKHYSAPELSALVASRSGIDFGEIEELVPKERTPSGRIVRLLVVGSKRSVIVGKELEIRRWLSPTHLRSSAFSAARDAAGNWTLRGRGWGHGVGMCQIGAAVMGSFGYSSRQILAHYFPAATLTELY